MRSRTLLASLLLFAGSASSAQTPLNNSFTYQGELRDGGMTVNGLYDLRFRLYDSATGGAQVGPTLCADNVSLVQGRFTISLDFGPAFTGLQRFIEIDVRADSGLACDDPAGFAPLNPRQQLTAAPSALYSLNASSAIAADSALSAANASQLNGQSASFYTSASSLSTGTLASDRLSGQYSGPLNFSNSMNSYSGVGTGLTGLVASNVLSGTLDDARLSGNVALLSGAQEFTGLKSFLAVPAFNGGTSESTAPFTVSSSFLVSGLNADFLDGFHASAFLQAVPVPLTLRGSSITHIILGENATSSNGARGVSGISTAEIGVTYGIFGQSNSTSGIGVNGQAGSSSGFTYGVVGQSSSTNGTGVSGIVTAFSGTTTGGEFRSDSTAGRGVFGHATATSGNAIGGQFESDARTGDGVRAIATSESGATHGVYGLSQSTSGVGIYGQAAATRGNTVGVVGISNSSEGRGLFGSTQSSIGTTYGVIGESTSSAGWAVFGNGRIGGSGNKSFRIDHPADPENQYLSHYCIESPEVLNVYSGTVAVDGFGEAIISLPPYFAAINKEPRYTLTAVGAPMPMLHVAEEIDEAVLVAAAAAAPGTDLPSCTFKISGAAPNSKVSWEVKAVRNDRWMQRYGAPVETWKQDRERGTYQHPDLYGQPKDRGMNGNLTVERP